MKLQSNSGPTPGVAHHVLCGRDRGVRRRGCGPLGHHVQPDQASQPQVAGAHGARALAGFWIGLESHDLRAVPRGARQLRPRVRGHARQQPAVAARRERQHPGRGCTTLRAQHPRTRGHGRSRDLPCLHIPEERVCREDPDLQPHGREPGRYGHRPAPDRLSVRRRSRHRLRRSRSTSSTTGLRERHLRRLGRRGSRGRALLRLRGQPRVHVSVYVLVDPGVGLGTGCRDPHVGRLTSPPRSSRSTTATACLPPRSGSRPPAVCPWSRAAPPPATAGGAIAYSLSVVNAGPSTAENVVAKRTSCRPRSTSPASRSRAVARA